MRYCFKVKISGVAILPGGSTVRRRGPARSPLLRVDERIPVSRKFRKVPRTTRRLAAATLPLLLMLCSVSAAQSVSSLVEEVAELARGLSNASSLTEEHQALINSARDIAMDWTKDQAKEKFIEFAQEGTTKTVAGQLHAVWEDARQALAAVKVVNTNLPDAPDLSHLDYCAQAKASANEIARIQSAIDNLNAIVNDAKSFKALLSPLDDMSRVLAGAFGKLMALDAVLEQTTYGTYAQQWEFYFKNGGSESDPDAGYYISDAKQNWDEVEKEAGDKATKLRATLDARTAYDRHFYFNAAENCADAAVLAAALASFNSPSLPPIPGSSPTKGPGIDACQVAAQNAASFLASCMHPQASMCGSFTTTAACYSRASTQCGACGTCAIQMQSAAAQARASAQQVCAN